MTTSASRAGHREWIGLAVIALPCLVYAMDLTVLNLALPALSADLHPTSTQLLWIVDVYGFMVAGALVTMGALGDRLGARRLLLYGAAAFAGASVLAAFAPSAGLLIAARALLGLAGATLAPSTLSLIRTMFADDRERTIAIGVWVMSYSLGSAVGPLAGGALLEVARWGSVFLLGVPVMLLLLVVGPRLLPEPPPGTSRLDVPGAALSLAAVLAVVFGLKQAIAADNRLVAVLAIGGGLALGGVFTHRQRRTEALIDFSLFRVGDYASALAINVMAFFVVFGMSLFLAQYLQSVLGLSPLMAGVWSVPEALGFVAGSLVTPRLAARWTPQGVVAAGLLVGALGWALVATADGDLAPVIAGSTFGAIGLAAVATLVTDLAVSAAPPSRAGAAAALSETSSELGGALGLAVLGSIGAATYRAGIPSTAPAAAHQTLSAALGAHGPAAALADTARAAFTHAFQVTALVSVAVLLLAAGVAAARLRRRTGAASAALGSACV